MAPVNIDAYDYSCCKWCVATLYSYAFAHINIYIPVQLHYLPIHSGVKIHRIIYAMQCTHSQPPASQPARSIDDDDDDDRLKRCSELLLQRVELSGTHSLSVSL